MSGVTGGRRGKRTTARIEAPTQSRKRSATATPRTYGTAPALDPSARARTSNGGVLLLDTGSRAFCLSSRRLLAILLVAK
jgi:hypothetical protein